ncbi:MAG TPA: VWA domain-containing protein [Longimicrobiales bacterium]|nr:VWA domain-containing protein [Longimicrobiales bacterium]
MKTEILLDHEPTGNGYLVRALLRITGDAPEGTDRRRLNLGVVLDRSGSMAALGKLDRAREAARLLVRRLDPEDVLSIVAYDDDVRTIARRLPGSRHQDLLDAIATIQPGGMTNLSGGWLRGSELVGAERDRRQGTGSGTGTSTDGGTDGGTGERPSTDLEAVDRVLLLTDGLANVGITDGTQLRGLVASAAARGVTTTTIGFGADFEERLLRGLADAGGGSTYYIEEPDQAPAVFEAELEGLMSLAAQNVAVTVAPASAAGITAVHHQYPRQQNDDGTLRLELGDLYALEPRSLLMEFLISGDDGAEVDVATLTLEGYVLQPGGGLEKRSVTLPIRVSRAGGPVVDPVVRRELLLLEAARVREAAVEDRANGDFAAGGRKLRRLAERMAPMAADPEIRDEVEDLRDLAEKFSAAEVSASDAKWMYQRAYSSGRSRPKSMESLSAARALKREGARGTRDREADGDGR